MPKLTAAELDRDFDRPLAQPANPISLKGAHQIRSIYRWARAAHPLVPAEDVLHELVAELGFALEGYESSVELGMRIARYAGLFENEEDAWDICQTNYEEAIDSYTAGDVPVLSEDELREGFDRHSAIAELFQSAEGRKIARARAAFDTAFRSKVTELRSIMTDCLDEDLDRVMAQPFIIAMEDGLQDDIPALLGFFVVTATVEPGPDEIDQNSFEF